MSVYRLIILEKLNWNGQLFIREKFDNIFVMFCNIYKYGLDY